MSLEILPNSTIFYNNRLIPSVGPFALLLRCYFYNLPDNTPTGNYYIFRLTSSSTSETLRFGIKYNKVTRVQSLVLNYTSSSQNFTLELNSNTSFIGNCIIFERDSSNTLKFWTEYPSVINQSVILNSQALNSIDQVWIYGSTNFNYNIKDFTIWSTNGYNSTTINDLLNLHPSLYTNLNPLVFHHNFLKSQNNPYVFSPVLPVYTNISFSGSLPSYVSKFEDAFSYNFSNNRSVAPPETTEYIIDLVNTLGFNVSGSGQNVQVPPHSLENIIKISQTITTGGSLSTHVWEEFLTFVQSIHTTIIEKPRNYIYLVEEWLLEREILEPGSTEEIIRIVEEIVRVVDINRSVDNQLTLHSDIQLIKQNSGDNYGNT